ncbi:MAG: glycosyltransferase family 2 protein [Lachnospiraceae bacterium]|nr:glycosyltransferase family 2 protein [Lachnospiraceae bacterium]
MKIAIIVSCFNRKAMTQRCLAQLYQQATEYTEHSFIFFIHDDASTDGTQEMIIRDFPNARLMRSQGGLYWCKSMHRAMEEATVKGEFDLYLMINDDVDFEDNALAIMLHSYKIASKPCAIVGATKKTLSSEVSYGGRTKEGQLIVPNKELQRCMWANWNCFLVDREVVNKVGIIDGKYQHSWGDFDYSFRMGKKDYPIYLATDYIGKCDNNCVEGTFRDKKLGKRKQLQKLFSPKGVPFYSYMRYHMRVQGKIGFLKYLYGYLSIIGYIVLGKTLK